MTAKSYFGGMLFAPLIVPLTIYVFGSHLVTGILFLSLQFAGIPYLIFATVVLIWMRSHDARATRVLSYWMPVIFIPVEIGYLSIKFFIDKSVSPELSDLSGSIIVASVYVLVIGYAYVGFVNGGYWVLSKLSVIRDKI